VHTNPCGPSCAPFTLGGALPDAVAAALDAAGRAGDGVVVLCGGMVYDGGFDLCGLLLRSLVDVSLRAASAARLDPGPRADDGPPLRRGAPEILVSYSTRDEETEKFFLSRARSCFRVEVHETDAAAKACLGGRIAIVRLRLLEEAAGAGGGRPIEVRAMQTFCQHCRQWTRTHAPEGCPLRTRRMERGRA
jgi:hypothetical protein